MSIPGIIAVLSLVSISGLFVYSMMRNRSNLIRIAQEDEKGFSSLSRREKKEALRKLYRKYPCIEELITWYDARLMLLKKQHGIRILLEQEWCLEDRVGDADAPIRFRPSLMRVEAGDQRFEKSVEFSADAFLDGEASELLGWTLMERAKTLVPFRIYRMTANKTTRNFTPREGISVSWETDSITKTDYLLEIK